MASAQPIRRGAIISDINVTPLVDVVLVLLVVLMVTASYIVSRSIPVDLPRGATGESVPTTLALSVDKSGAMFLEGEPVTPAELRRRANDARAADPEARAIVAADGSAEHRSVVRVVDLLRQAGIARFAINVQPEDLSSR